MLSESRNGSISWKISTLQCMWFTRFGADYIHTRKSSMNFLTHSDRIRFKKKSHSARLDVTGVSYSSEYN